MRGRWRLFGTHIRVSVLTAEIVERQQEPRAFTLCGILTFSRHEWHDVVALLNPAVDVIEDRD